ncbi:nitronate monooxygenase [Anaerococcus sp. AGMB00486]|uniref:Probable nitronate monooxygenase n=2 Tax=Anaerococcus TaxID=165779 RepID=A0ABX2N9X1_9FIRM|nr:MULTISPECIES: nitronate monooxygenase [Anaerococcus]MSS78329.1 enoyl-[acyl-carrier-protein] reductase FabK [Anaerococcus porci]NVF11443.1 nitronate monooxygenase [Anaerococcus faecalis]
MDLKKLLDIKYPIIQGGMAHIANGEFAGAVSSAGGLGIIGSGGMDSNSLRENIRALRKITDKPFGVNLMMLRPDIDKLVKVVLEEDVNIITVGAGSYEKYADDFENKKIKVLQLISSPIQIKRYEALEPFAFIAEGLEAGGHIGQMTTMTLIPQAIAQTKRPVIAAGGIASGREIFAAEVLGASGVQIGTGFLFTKECPIHENYKNKLLKSNSSKVTVIGNINGIPMRVLKNKMTREYQRLERNNSLLELENFTIGRLRKAVVEGDVENGSVMTGLSIGSFNSVISVKEYIEKLMSEYREIKDEYKNKK